MGTGDLGKSYTCGETILHQGEPVKSMFVIQDGEAEVLREQAGQQVHLTVLKEQDFFGEVPFFERPKDGGLGRATIRAINDVRVITVDKKTILKRLHEDPSLGYRIMKIMSRRIEELEEEVVRAVMGDE